jgi:cephalosporin-C deacetylase-like acetyl esterase
VRAPALIVAGEEDIPEVHAHCGAIQAALSAERIVVPGAGHLVHLEKPAALAGLILDFLAPRAWIERYLAAPGADLPGKTVLARFEREAVPGSGFEVRGKETRGEAEVLDVTYASHAGGRVTAYLVRPVAAAASRPGALFLHHGQGNRSTFLDDALPLARDGVISLLVDGPFSRPEPWRSSPGFDPGKSADETIAIVKDLRRGIDLLLSAEKVDPRRIAYVGHSYGSTVGAVLLGVEERIHAAVMMAGFSSLTQALSTGEDRVSTAVRTLLKPEEREAYFAALRPFDGTLYLPRRPRGQPLLLQYARRDEYITRRDAAVYEAAAGPPCRVEWHDSDHFLNEDARRARLGWLREALGVGGSPTPAGR